MHESYEKDESCEIRHKQIDIILYIQEYKLYYTVIYYKYKMYSASKSKEEISRHLQPPTSKRNCHPTRPGNIFILLLPVDE